MKILATNVYVGPNLYAQFRVIRHQVDLGVLEEWPSVRLGESFIASLMEALPGLANHGCSYGEPGGFLRRLREEEGTWMAHIWEHAAIEMQNMAGSNVSFGKTRGMGPPGQYNMVFECMQKDVGLEAARISRQLLLSLLPAALKERLADEIEPGFDFQAERGYCYRSYFADPGAWCNCFKVSADGPPGLWRTDRQQALDAGETMGPTGLPPPEAPQ